MSAARSGSMPVVWDYALPRPIVRTSARWLTVYSLVVALLDAVSAVVAGLLTHRDHSPLGWAGLLVVFPALWVGSLTLARTYEHRFTGNGNEEYRRLFDAGVRVLAVAAAVGYAVRSDSGRNLIVVGIPLALIFSLLVHYGARQVLHRLRERGRCLQRVVVVGRERSIAELVRTVRSEPQAGFQVVAACVDRSRADYIENVPVLGDSEAVVDVLAACDADTVMITAWSDVSQTELRRLSWDLEGSRVSLLVAPRLTDVAGPRIHVRPVAGLPLLNIEEPEFSGVRRIVKSIIDRVGALVALVVLSPLMLVTAVLVRMTSSGPVLFRQVRIGRHGKPFLMRKFRSMYVDSEERRRELEDYNEAAIEGPLFKIRKDPRVTRVGRFIRRMSIDELPQLIDVLLGRMSLVGPRPPLPGEVEQYPVDVRRRLIVKPGITGLWQVNGRSDLSWEEAVRLDLHYVENWSLALDVAIVLKTLIAVLRRRGAY
jgi:exopolysaccharide biosynthesis polyprenyl glycosylphosphotransferase